jgi:hypothetical protein
MKVGMLHPDLGIGGAERLVVDAALGLVRNVCGSCTLALAAYLLLVALTGGARLAEPRGAHVHIALQP